MDKTFQKLLQTDIDLSSLGVERRTDNEPYFCTPKGASVFGWTGVDGIHFCFVRGFGGMVFAVSPANTFPNYVHPLAKNFTMLWTRTQNQLSRSGKSTLRETSGDIREKNVPEQKSP